MRVYKSEKKPGIWWGKGAIMPVLFKMNGSGEAGGRSKRSAVDQHSMHSACNINSGGNRSWKNNRLSLEFSDRLIDYNRLFRYNIEASTYLFKQIKYITIQNFFFFIIDVSDEYSIIGNPAVSDWLFDYFVDRFHL